MRGSATLIKILVNTSLEIIEKAPSNQSYPQNKDLIYITLKEGFTIKISRP